MNKIIKHLIAGTCSLSLAGSLACDPGDFLPFPKAPPDAPGKEGPDPQDLPDSVLTQVRSPVERDTEPDLTDAAREQLRAGNNDLSFDMLRALDKGDNLAVSAPNLRMSMAMLYAMGRGDTQKEIGDAMMFPEDPQLTMAGLSELDLALNARNLEASKHRGPVIYAAANRIVADPSIAPGPTFLDQMAKHFGIGVLLGDFARDSDEILDELNAWIARKTRNRVPTLLSRDHVNPNADWAFVNALYFRAPWSFDEMDSGLGEFHGLDNRPRAVATLSKDGFVTRFGRGEGFEWASVPLRDEKLEFTLIVPDKGQLASVRNKLSSASLDGMLDEATQGVLHLTFPKFNIEAKARDLVPFLESKGMRLPFSPSADFRGFSDGRQNPHRLTFLSQSVNIAADRKGIEAGASLAMGAASSLPEHILNVDRPFLFTIYDRPTGQVLFAGQLLDP